MSWTDAKHVAKIGGKFANSLPRNSKPLASCRQSLVPKIAWAKVVSCNVYPQSNGCRIASVEHPSKDKRQLFRQFRD
jgi:hypothetical protein